MQAALDGFRRADGIEGAVGRHDHRRKDKCEAGASSKAKAPRLHVEPRADHEHIAMERRRLHQPDMSPSGATNIILVTEGLNTMDRR